MIIGGTGPMGLLAIDYALHGPKKPGKLIVTDRNKDKLDRAKKLYPSTDEVEVEYVDVSQIEDQVSYFSGKLPEKFNDIFVMVPVDTVVNEASRLLAADGCLNFFAGPQDKEFSAKVNFYDIHYSFTHYVGTSGGNTEDMRKAVKLIEEKKVKVANVVTHILGLDDVAETTLNQPQIGGGKKLIYTHKKFNRMKLSDIDPKSTLGEILAKHDGIWNKEAEEYVLETFENI